MVSPVLITVALYLFFYWLWEFINARPKNFPPGPTRTPIFGNYLYLILRNFNAVHEELAVWTKKYKSKVVSFFVGPFRGISTGDRELIREIFMRKEFDGRPFPFAVAIRSWSKRLGIFFTDGNFWLEQRRFSLRYMRDFGLGRRLPKLEYVMEDEIKGLLSLIESGPAKSLDEDIIRKDRLILLPDFTTTFFINGLLTIFTGQPISYERRKRLRQAADGALLFVRKSDGTGGTISIIPWIRYFFPKLSGYHGIMKGNQELIDFMKEIIEDRKKYIDQETEGFIDFYLKEIKAREALGNYTSFSEEQLLLTCVDMLLATGASLGVTMGLLIQNLLHHPEIQDKMYNEIVSVVGTGRLPNLDDRSSLPYCEATLREAMRIDTTITVGVPHLSTANTDLHGFNIPKDTIIFTNLWQMHHDENIWGDPNNFRPERFLDAYGKLNLKLDQSLPFGLGRRVCVGETFSRNSLFLFVTGLIQNYRVQPAPGDPLPDLSKRYPGFVRSMPKYWIQCIPRN